MFNTVLAREGTTGWESVLLQLNRGSRQRHRNSTRNTSVYSVWQERSSDIWAELGATQQESLCSSPWLGEAGRSPKHSTLLLSTLSQAWEFLAILLGEALIYLFNGESKQQLEKSAPAFWIDC